jgi:hypothetical protein
MTSKQESALAKKARDAMRIKIMVQYGGGFFHHAFSE